jgi:6-pyruvoyl-tetrahydropterin synthase
MKKPLIILLLISQIVAFSQTKKETFDYINEKLELYKLDDSKTNYVFIFQEVKIDDKEYINLIEICTLFSRCSTAYSFKPDNYSSITTKENAETIWIEIHCKYNSIETQEIDLNTRKRYIGEDVSKITIILGKDTPQNEIDKIKRAFLHLLKLYGVEKIDLFEK